MVMIGAESIAALSRRYEGAVTLLQDLHGSIDAATVWDAPQKQRFLGELTGITDALRGVEHDLGELDLAQTDALAGVQRLTRSLDDAGSKLETWPAQMPGRLRDSLGMVEADRLRLDVLRTTGTLADELRAEPTAAQQRLMAKLDATLHKPDEAITREDIRFLASVDGLPDALRPPMPMPTRWTNPYIDQFVQGHLPAGRSSWGQVSSAMDVHRWRSALEGMQLGRDPEAASKIAAQLERIRTTPVDELTLEDLHQLTVFDHAPGALRPALPQPMTQPIVDLYREAVREGKMTGQAKLELRSVQLSQDARHLAAEPGVTKEGFAAEVEAVAARPVSELTWDELRRVAIIERLPAELRPDFPQPLLGPDRTFARELATVDRPERWNSIMGFSGEVSNLQFMQQQRELAALPSTTAESMATEVDSLLETPIEQIDAEQLRRFALIDGLPANLRPDLPPSELYPTSLTSLAVRGVDGTKEDVRWALDTVRSWRETTSPAGRERLRGELAAGGVVDSHQLQQLSASPELRAALDLDDEEMFGLAMRSVASDAGNRNVRVDLEIARRALDQLEETDAGLQQIHDQILGLFDDALRPGYPEYAQIGRATAMAELLVRARQAARETAAGAARDAGHELLSW